MRNLGNWPPMTQKPFSSRVAEVGVALTKRQALPRKLGRAMQAPPITPRHITHVRRKAYGGREVLQLGSILLSAVLRVVVLP